MAACEVVVDRQKVATLEEACVYDAVSSYNFLNAELGRLVRIVAEGSVLRIEDQQGSFVLRSADEVLAWARGASPMRGLDNENSGQVISAPRGA